MLVRVRDRSLLLLQRLDYLDTLKRSQVSPSYSFVHNYSTLSIAILAR